MMKKQKKNTLRTGGNNGPHEGILNKGSKCTQQNEKYV